MIGGLAWLFHKQRGRRVDSTQSVPIRHMGGYHTSLSGFLERFHPGIKMFVSMGRADWDVWLPEDPGRKIAEKAVDAAWERSES